MWIILGNRVESRRVPDGRKVERRCTACGETAMFYEREVTRSFALYFVSIFNYKTQRVMACGACGELYATDELGAPADTFEDQQKGTVVGDVAGAFRRMGDKLDEAIGVPPSQRRSAEPPRSTARPSVSDDDVVDADIDPLADDDDDLKARFAALEAKLRKQGKLPPNSRK